MMTEIQTIDGDHKDALPKKANIKKKKIYSYRAGFQTLGWNSIGHILIFQLLDIQTLFWIWTLDAQFLLCNRHSPYSKAAQVFIAELKNLNKEMAKKMKVVK